MARIDDDWIKLLFDTYRNHSIAVKQISTSRDCHTYDEWAWLNLGECIADCYQWFGFVIGVLSTFVFVSARCKSMLYMKQVFNEKWPTILALSFTLDVLSLLGAVLAMQLFQVILFDFMMALTHSIMVIVLVVKSLPRVIHNREGYMEIRHPQTEDPSAPERNQNVRNLLCKMSCLALSILATPLLMTSRWLKNTSQRAIESMDFPESTNQYTHALVNSSGFLMGGMACFGQWALQFYMMTTKWLNPKNRHSGLSDPASVTVTSVVLITCDVLYMTGVLLHSRGWMVAMVTLPWTMQRLVDAGFQTVHLCPSFWNCHDDGRNSRNPRYDDINSLMESGSESSSGSSDTASSNVLWDRNWKLPGVKDPYVYYEQIQHTGRIYDTARLKLISGDVTTSVESDWSTTSAEQELEWEDETTLHIQISPYHQIDPDRRKATPHNLTPLTLTPIMAQSRVERVRSWVSNSTPEEETTPCLTAALDLDHNSNYFSGLYCGEDPKMTCYVPQRKYSI